MTFSQLGCPSSPLPSTTPGNSATSAYAACHHDVEAPIDKDNHGMFYLNSRLHSAEVPDGLSYTIYVGEKKADEWDFGWLSGTRSTLRNTGTPINASVPLPPVVPWKTPAEQEAERKTMAAEGLIPKEEPETDPGRWMQYYPGRLSPTSLTGPIEDLAPTVKADQLYVGGFASFHPGGANFLFGDGAVRFLSAMIDTAAYQQLGHRDDGKLLPETPY
jgi:prepilin-type processing-associated H-X9-DG protein